MNEAPLSKTATDEDFLLSCCHSEVARQQASRIVWLSSKTKLKMKFFQQNGKKKKRNVN